MVSATPVAAGPMAHARPAIWSRGRAFAGQFGRLAALRAVPLFLRPAAVMAEGLLLDNRQLLVVTIPLVALALTISAIPVHVDYFTSNAKSSDHARKGADYAASLTIIVLAAAAILPLFAGLIPVARDPFVLAAVSAFFISEKFVDEVSRWIEFKKQFGRWFLIQAFRSVWLFVPLGLARAGLSYEGAFFGAALLAAAASLVLFIRVLGLSPRVSARGFGLIGGKAFYLLGSSLPALYRQGPRLAIVGLFPSFAHLYLFTAQVTQVISLLFDVKISIPYRKMSARHPRLFLAAWRPVMAASAKGFAAIAGLYLLGSMLVAPADLPRPALAALLAPLLIAEGLSLSLFTFAAGLLPWFVGQFRASLSYAACLALYPVPVLALAAGLGSADARLLFAVPAANLLVGLVWRSILVNRHFGL